MKQCCRTCVHLDVNPNAAGKRVPLRTHCYACTAPLPDIKLPESVTVSYGFLWPPSRCYMTPDRGTECPTWEPRPKT